MKNEKFQTLNNTFLDRLVENGLLPDEVKSALFDQNYKKKLIFSSLPKNKNHCQC